MVENKCMTAELKVIVVSQAEMLLRMGQTVLELNIISEQRNEMPAKQCIVSKIVRSMIA